jgi:predicted metal-dependent hydrolase
VDNFPFELKVKRYRASRSLKLRIVDDGSVLVTAHTLTPQFHIKKFINEHIDWINDNLAKVKRQNSHLTASRQSLLLRGQPYQFLLAVSSKKTVKISGSKMIVYSPNEDHHIVRAVLEKWYKQKAKEYFGERIKLLGDLVDSDVRKVTIRSQRSRWGSCSSRQTISLNWRLILCPDWVSDYVIYHELAHLKQMNHSRKFWLLVESYFPKYSEAEQWLKTNHSLLKF